MSIKKGGKYENLKFLLTQRRKRINFNFVEQKKKSFIIVTKNQTNHGSNKIYSNLCEQRR